MLFLGPHISHRRANSTVDSMALRQALSMLHHFMESKANPGWHMCKAKFSQVILCPIYAAIVQQKFNAALVYTIPRARYVQESLQSCTVIARKTDQCFYSSDRQC